MELSLKIRHSSCVLITGASSGIGMALAVEFARRGHDLALVARNGGILGELATRMSREHGVRAWTLSCDLATAEAPAQVLSWLEENSITVDVLVNNAGFTEHGPFVETDLAREASMVLLQIQTPLELAKRLLPAMIRRRRGGILNIASVYSFSPVPQQAVYGACKAFLLSFAEALAMELDGTGVRITTICPGVTRTEFRQRARMLEKSPDSGMSAEQVARMSVRAFERGERISVPGALNKLFVRGCRLMPMTWVSSTVRRINGARGIHRQEVL